MGVSRNQSMTGKISNDLNQIGINYNFSPVVDMSPNSTVGYRSFGKNPENIIPWSNQFIQTTQKNNIIATAKHFPGHGDTDLDSHKILPTISFTKKRLDSIELHPYKRLFQEGLSSVMVAHLNVPALEKRKNFPSSISKAIVTDLLQDDLNFQGLIFTDALNMKGASNFKKPGEIDLAAFLAGNDVLLISESIPKAHQLIVEAFRNG